MKIVYWLYAVSVLVMPACLHAQPVSEIRYDYDTDTLTLNLQDVYLVDVLQRLSAEIGFELEMEDVTARRRVDFAGSGPSHELVRRLVGSDSAVLSRYKTAPYRLKNVILLPDGDADSSYLPAETMERVPDAGGAVDSDAGGAMPE